MYKKRLSPFSVDFWVNKGYSYEDALYERNSRRPINKEYWIKKGYSESEAELYASRTKTNNNKKGAKKNAERSIDELRESSVRCKEYWIKRGFTDKEAAQKVKEFQATFSREKCIEKYGKEKGETVFNERQKRWLSSMEKYDSLDKNALDAEKLLRKHKTIENVAAVLKESRNMHIPLTIDDLKEHIKIEVNKRPYLSYYYPEKLFDHLPGVWFDLHNVKDPINFLKEFTTHAGEVSDPETSKSWGYRKWTEDGKLLRSSYEILFSELLDSYCLNYDVDGFYNLSDSKERYDFKVNGIYIEISPRYNRDQDITKKINDKKKKYNCYVLKDTNEFEPFIQRYLLENEPE